MGYCMDELASQLFTLVVLKQIAGQMQETMVPWMKGKLAARKERKAMLAKAVDKDGDGDIDEADLKKAEVWEEEAKLAPYEGTFADYNEMIIQFGFVTLFAAAFPVASLASLINNITEIRTDASKLLNSTQRPKYAGAEDIGTWFKILEIQSYIAVLTNICILGFTSANIRLNLHTGLPDEYGQVDSTKLLYFLIVLEHIIFFVKYMLATIIPDSPGWVLRAVAYTEFAKSVESRMVNPNADMDEKWDDSVMADEKFEK